MMEAANTSMNPATLCALGIGLGLGLLAAGHAGTFASVRTYWGLCDASAVEALDADYFAVGDDEDNVIRVYHRQHGVLPAFSLDLSGFLQTEPEEPETDLEGAARLGNLVFWITSHGRNRKGEECPSRQHLFATAGSVSNGLVRLEPVGLPYTRLLDDLLADARLRRFNLDAAARLAPKAHGGLNIEGLTATPEGQLWIGFRSPVPDGQALLVPLLNPAEVIAGGSARLGESVLLPLGGLGVRSLTSWRGVYLIIAGSTGDEGRSELYLWSGGTDRPRRVERSDLTGLNPESLAAFPESGDNDLLLVSDDGNLLVGKKPCKRLKQHTQKRFRGASLAAEVVSPGPASPVNR